MVKVIWSKRAFGQFERAVKNIKEERGVAYAEIVLNKILAATALLGDQPQMGKVEPLLAHKKTEYRFVVVWSYKIIYKVDPNQVVVSRLFHTSQNPGKIKGV